MGRVFWARTSWETLTALPFPRASETQGAPFVQPWAVRTLAEWGREVPVRVGGACRRAGSVRPQCPASAQFTAKQLEKLAKKAEKDSKAEQAKVKKVRPRLWLCWRLPSVWGALPATLAAAVLTGASSRPAVAPVCPPAPRECPEPKDRACLAFVSWTVRAFYSLPKR